MTGRKTRQATRRSFLKLGLGATQLALLDRLGLSPLSRLSGRRARAAGVGTDHPSRLLTIWVPGGWVPYYLWTPFTPAEIATHIPAPTTIMNEPVYFTGEQVTNLDGSGDALGPDGFSRLRVPKLWDEADFADGGDGHGSGTSPHGYSWAHHALWDCTSVVHGLDQGTLAHASALISAMCGVAGPTYQSPAMQAWVAHALSAAFGDDRPLASVVVGNGPVPNPGGLPAVAAPTLMPDLNALNYTLSEGNDSAWEGLRLRADGPAQDFWGAAAGTLPTNPMDDAVLARLQALGGTTNTATDALLESVYGRYATLSSQLAQDLVSVIAATPGQEHLPHPSWVPSNWSYYGVAMGPGQTNFNGNPWLADFDLALKLLKSDLVTSVSLEARGAYDFYFDNHSIGHPTHFVYLRSLNDTLGRLVAEMAATPIGGGKTLLDDTLVVIFSEFARTWPMGGTCDHWGATSAVLCGGGIAPNRMVGGYDLSTGPPTSIGFMGKSIDLIDEGGDAIFRAPRSADLVWTVLKRFGIDNAFIPGGPGDITGVQPS